MNSTVERAIRIAAGIRTDVASTVLPPDEGMPCRSQRLLPISIVKATRGYIERVAHQANGCYENGWYDACAVMIRRLIETLLIEAFEHCGIADKIRDPATHDFYSLGDLIQAALREPTWNLSRNTRRVLPQLKDLGDWSAHARRYNAHRHDIDRLIPFLRVVAQEFVYLAGLK